MAAFDRLDAARTVPYHRPVRVLGPDHPHLPSPFGGVVRTIASRTRPPGPSGLPFVGNASQYTRDPFGFMLHCAREYGPVSYARLSGRPHFLLTRPADVEHVLITNHRNYSKGAIQARESSLFGNGLLLSEGDFWRAQRRIMQPAFHRRRVEQYAGIMTAATERMLADWQDGTTRDIHHDMMKLTLEIVVEVLFGADLHDRAQRLARAFAVVGEHFQVVYDRTFFVPEWIPIPGNRRYRKALDSLDREVDRIIRERRASDTGGDLLAMLLEARDDDGRPMSDRQLRDEVMGLFLAGHETTAITLAFACHLLGHHPDQEAKLLAELRTCLRGRLPTVEDLPRLQFTEQVTKEALRLYPAVYSMLREARQDDQLGGYHVPAGTTVILPQWVIHRDGRFYPDPEVFAPERWTREFERSLPRCAYFPFGAGPRVCIGNSFALMELNLILPTILQRWHLESASATPLELMASITTRPRRGIAMVVHRR
jgi:cytochrome P450